MRRDHPARVSTTRRAVLRATVITPIPSPYQVELFDALPAAGAVARVVYVERTHADRHWGVPAVRHEHVVLSDGPGARRTAEQWVEEADGVVVSWYADRRCRELMRRRASSGHPWCFWGERPGFGRFGVLGRLRRRFLLAPLRQCDAPIWGIGSWAVAKWRAEFGEGRAYHNVPYVSDLARFRHVGETLPQSRVRRLLFSGSLTHRKGVDLLAEAFVRVARTRPALHLDVVGTGPLEATLRAQFASVAAQVRFHGFVPWADLPVRYHGADVLVAPSRYDGWGLIVPEGLAAGLPVIGTDRTGAALDLLEPGRNGWRVPAGSLPELIHALEEAADLPNERLAAMSASAVASVERHTLSAGAARWVAALAATVGRRA